ncbi:septal ring lytic transglycosylase RlpA family protein [Falsiroseomonas sp.]|uniref:septal ring lytic transglycosylase RlpA family protein n=1 Tax=Falsiroseomonas sp. TaxID=2870721 RepID=UPI0027345E65|nr:septal ring lytic transglycosylase RlpA family protein [Falsiroseomonas sp.]MDP3415689.1 septal ring lytic transglycosylase RlpA family protein [Falsiroseomonas sp.]
MSGLRKWLLALAGLVCLGATPVAANTAPAQPGDDTSGRIQRGEASFYHQRFHGQRMANGSRFHARSNSAASRTLPLGTVARVTNLATGQSAQVRIEDRGPRARHRIIDVSPRTATQLGMRRSGTARVEVAPIAVPQRDGSIRRHAPARPAPARPAPGRPAR